MTKQNIILIIAAWLLLTSCSTGQLQISSQPDSADIFISSATIPTKKIGNTPLLQTENLLSNNSEPYQLTISKPGYEDSTILIPATTLKRNVSVSVKLKELSSNKSQTSSEIDKIASQVAQVQNLIKTKELIQAERQIYTLLSQHPNVATFHELMGNVYYLQKNLKSALASYKKANELAPGNPDTMRMINKLQTFNNESKVN